MTFPIESYSSFGEDRLILKFLAKQPAGFYVDVGAHAPIDYSNTYALYRRGWRGLAIDPDPEAIAAFGKERPEDITLQVAVGSKPGKVTLHLFNDRSMNTVDDTLFEKTLDNPRKRHQGDIVVERRTLANILARHVPPGRQVDFLNVDCEGADLDVLRSNDWARFHPRLVAVEDLELDLERVTESRIFRFLRPLGYRLVSHLHYTSLYRLS
ncbi:FkbM family methyltransferase [Dongia sp.]|uniref:FkbM family methyltransferase n=1 Tax=Dongia sp. TaxID=1977262 RepID=UPI0035B421E0